MYMRKISLPKARATALASALARMPPSACLGFPAVAWTLMLAATAARGAAASVPITLITLRIRMAAT